MTGVIHLSPALPEWQCHKRVRAAQIVAINEVRTAFNGPSRSRLHFDDGQSITVDATWIERHSARVGGYYVVYDDGYASYSPQAAFESGYSPIPASPILA